MHENEIKESTKIFNTSSHSTEQEKSENTRLSESKTPVHPKDQPVLHQVIALNKINECTYLGTIPTHPRWGRLYGGLIVAQALSAAYKTIEDPNNFVLHSLHSYFLHSGDDTQSVEYQVQYLKNVGSFRTRQVSASQDSTVIFTLTAQFHRIEGESFIHQESLPSNQPNQKDLPTINERLSEIIKDDTSELEEYDRAYIKHSVEMYTPIECKFCNPEDVLPQQWRVYPPPKPRPPKKVTYIRIHRRMSDLKCDHHIALAYMSDWGIIETSLRPHRIGYYDTTIAPSSLSHSIYIHDPNVRLDEWVICQVYSPVLRGKIALIQSKFFTESGVYFASVTQEALIRIRSPINTDNNDNTRSTSIRAGNPRAGAVLSSNIKPPSNTLLDTNHLKGTNGTSIISSLDPLVHTLTPIIITDDPNLLHHCEVTRDILGSDTAGSRPPLFTGLVRILRGGNSNNDTNRPARL